MIKYSNYGYDNQIRIKKNRDIYYSRIVGVEQIGGLKFHLETFDARNGYVGPQAAKDKEYIDELYKVLINCWIENRIWGVNYWK